MHHSISQDDEVSTKVRKIIHIDMDAFYASVEQRDFPEYAGKPLVVAGSPQSRGVVSAASYEARKFGIRSAMPSAQAYKLCPELVFAPARFAIYKEVSQQIRRIFFEYTDLVEPLSLDEAFLDVSESKSATRLAREIKQKIYESTALTASAGVSCSKFLAKVASGYQKPNGLTVIPPEKVAAFLQDLPIGKFFGIGKVTEKKMQSLGIHNGKDLKQKSEAELIRLFGKSGLYYYKICRGLDTSPVNPNRVRKSLGVETTYATDLQTKEEVEQALDTLLSTFLERKEKAKKQGRTITLKVKYADFTSITRSTSPGYYPNQKAEISKLLQDLLQQTDYGQKKIRLLGISLSNFANEEESKQPQLFVPKRRNLDK
ncbi:MAG: DNA polymerase IV [Spirochaetota bacterium]